MNNQRALRIAEFKHREGPLHQHQPGRALVYPYLVRIFCRALAITACIATACAAAERPPLSQSREARDIIRDRSLVIGRVVCAETQVRGADEIKPKAWGKIQTQCVTYTMSIGTMPADDLSLAYSICVGSALEACQSAIGIAEPCRDLASCRAALGVP